MSFQIYVHTVDTKGKLQSSVDPSNSNDLVRKSYVDAQITAGTTSNTYWLEPVEGILAAPPASPSSGDRYLVAASGLSGAFANQENDIAEYNGTSWDFTAEQEGGAVWIKDDNENRVFDGSSWVLMSSISGAVPLTKIAASGDNLASGAKVLETKAGTSVASGDLLTIDGNNKIDKATSIPSSLLSDATTSSKGIIQVGDGLAVTNGVLSVDSGTAANKILKAGANLSDGNILGITDDAGTLKVQAASSAQLRTAIGDASTSVKGVASFSSNDFSVSSGAVSVDVGMSTNQIVQSAGSLSNGSILKAATATYDSNTTYASLSGTYSESNSNLSYSSQADGTTLITISSISFSSGNFSSFSVGDHFYASGYSGPITSIDSGNDTLVWRYAYSFSSGTSLMSPTIHPGLTTGINNASAADIAGACRDASTSAKGVASFASGDFSVSSGAVSLKRQLLNNAGSGIPTSVSSISSFADLDEFYVFDLSGASSTATLTLPDLQGADALGRKIEIAVLGGMSASNALTVSGGNASNGYAQNIDSAASYVLSQNYQVLKLVVCELPTGSDGAAKTVYKIV